MLYVDQNIFINIIHGRLPQVFVACLWYIAGCSQFYHVTCWSCSVSAVIVNIDLTVRVHAAEHSAV